MEEDQLLALGRRHAQDGDLQSAVLQFERAASQAPRSAVCKVELGRALVRVGRPEEGFSCLVDAFGIDSLCPGVKDGFLEYYRAEIEASGVGLRLLVRNLSGGGSRDTESRAARDQNILKVWMTHESCFLVICVPVRTKQIRSMLACRWWSI